MCQHVWLELLAVILVFCGVGWPGEVPSNHSDHQSMD